MEYLDISKIKFLSNDNQLLSMYYDSKYYPSIKLKRCFPFQEANKYISVIESEKNEEIGIIYYLNQLSLEMYNLAINELNFRYFMPKVIKIKKVKEKRGFANIDIITTSGNKSIKIQDIPFNINMYPNGQVIIKDVDGNLYEVDINYLNSNDKNAKFIKNYI